MFIPVAPYYHPHDSDHNDTNKLQKQGLSLRQSIHCQSHVWLQQYHGGLQGMPICVCYVSCDASPSFEADRDGSLFALPFFFCCHHRSCKQNDARCQRVMRQSAMHVYKHPKRALVSNNR